MSTGINAINEAVKEASAFTARDGAELSVMDRRDGWVQVANGAGKSGWLSTEQVEILPGA